MVHFVMLNQRRRGTRQVRKLLMESHRMMLVVGVVTGITVKAYIRSSPRGTVLGSLHLGGSHCLPFSNEPNEAMTADVEATGTNNRPPTEPCRSQTTFSLFLQNPTFLVFLLVYGGSRALPNVPNDIHIIAIA
jgi:hypothetical protein